MLKQIINKFQNETEEDKMEEEKPKTNSATIQFQIEGEQLEKVNKVMNKTGYSRSVIGRVALNEFVKKEL